MFHDSSKNIADSFNKLAVTERPKGKTRSLSDPGGKPMVPVLADDRSVFNANNDSLCAFSVLFRVPDETDTVADRINSG